MSKSDRGALIFATTILAIVLLTGCSAFEALGGDLPATQADIQRLSDDSLTLQDMANRAAESGDSLGTILYSGGAGLASLLAAVGLSRRRRKVAILQEKLSKEATPA